MTKSVRSTNVVSDASVYEITADDIFKYSKIMLGKDIAFFDEWFNVRTFARIKDGMAVIICRKGRVDLSINARDYSVEENSFCVLSSNVVIGPSRSSDDFQCSFFYLSNKYVQDILLVRNRKIVIKDLFVQPIVNLTPDALAVFDNYYRFIEDRMSVVGNDYQPNIVRSLVCALFYELFSFAKQYSAEDDGEVVSSRHSDQLFKAFVDALHSDGVKRRSVASYAADLCITPKYLSVICKDNTGLTAMDFINEFVMQDVRRMLVYSDKSIKEISNELGFPNVSFFGKYVKMHSGLTPRQMRRSEL